LLNFSQALRIFQVKNYGPVPAEKHRKSPERESNIPTGNFPDFFADAFRPVPVESHRKLTGIHRKKSNKFPLGILLPLPAIFGAFLQDSVTFLLLSHRSLRDPVAVIFDLGKEVCKCRDMK
jgi:hypothetical protein